MVGALVLLPVIPLYTDSRIECLVEKFSKARAVTARERPAGLVDPSALLDRSRKKVGMPRQITPGLARRLHECPDPAGRAASHE